MKLLLPRAILLATVLATVLSTSLLAQNRPPATPLIAHNPYFSVWSLTDKLTGSPTAHWTGHAQPLTGLVRVDGHCFRVMGVNPRGLPAGTCPPLEQTALDLAPTHTHYSFAGAGITLELTFFTPAFLDDLDILSRPVTYLTWTARSTDGTPHDVSAFLQVSPDIATSTDGQPVTYSSKSTARNQVLSVGTKEQAVLNRSGDDLRADWGYFRLAVPLPFGNQPANAQAAIVRRGPSDFAEGKPLESADELDQTTTPEHFAPQLAVTLALGKVEAEPVARHMSLSFTQEFAFQLLQQNLRPYWQRNGQPVGKMLDAAEADYAALDARGQAFDKKLTADMTQVGGPHYAWLCTLAYRQAIAAHILVADADGKPLLFEKENFSNGDTATVDVIYPSAPIFLLFNPRLLEAEVTPVLRYASMSNRWKFPFAPHDLGQFPLANGQTYGGGERTEEDQMPVEESGNLVLLVDALTRKTNDTALAAKYWPQLTQWAVYLRQHGLDPENQLTTDDFAGHVTLNANLSCKAILALDAYADLAHRLGHEDDAKTYAAAAKTMAGQWVTRAEEGDHFKLAYDARDTWSQKYNLVWDKLLDFHLFPPSVHTREIAFYKTKLQKYGLPLDSRKDYTKLDWQVWTATLADNRQDFDTLIDPIYKWTNETKTRVPLTDWYDTITGDKVGFQARSVVGGIFIKALDDKPIATYWLNQPKP